MPGFDGTGPRSEGPMTGRGEGYCAIRLPEGGQPAFGHAGLQGFPVFMWPAMEPAAHSRYLMAYRSPPVLWRRTSRRWFRGRGHQARGW